MPTNGRRSYPTPERGYGSSENEDVGKEERLPRGNPYIGERGTASGAPLPGITQVPHVVAAVAW